MRKLCNEEYNHKGNRDWGIGIVVRNPSVKEIRNAF